MQTSIKDEVFFKKYYEQLCHFAWQILHDIDFAEDAVQDTFVNYLTKREIVFDHEIALKNFLYTSVRFNCYNQLRKNKYTLKYLNSLSQNEFRYDSEIEIKLIRAELMTDVCRTMIEMPESCRKIFQRGYLDGLTNLEIAKELEISINTVKTQKRRGLKLLKDRLHPELLASF